MNRLSHPILCQALLFAALHSNCATAAESPEPVSRVSVVFVEPQKFTDARRADFKPNSESLLDAIAQFMREMGEKALPPQMNLAIRVTDIDLAGNFEPWRGPLDHDYDALSAPCRCAGRRFHDGAQRAPPLRPLPVDPQPRHRRSN